MKLVILAGGSGTRLWPVSRKNTPKQTKPIIADKTLLVSTYDRLISGFRKSDIYIATNRSQIDIISKQLPRFLSKNYIIEPDKKDTAAAIGFAAATLHKKNSKEIMISINSDHYINNEKEGGEKNIAKEFKKIEPISMDYGIIEKTKDLLVIPADFGWADVGNWRTVKDILSKSKRGSITKGMVLNIEGSDNLVYNYSDKLITMVGVRGMVVIETEDSLLLCPKEKAQDVKKIVDKLKIKKLDKYL